MGSYAVIFTYQSDDETVVYLYDSKEKAVDFLRESIMQEYRIDVEENGFASSYYISEDGTRGTLTTYFDDHTDVMEVRIGSVYA